MAIAPSVQGSCAENRKGKMCLDNVLHLHMVFAQIEFRSKECSVGHQLVTSGAHCAYATVEAVLSPVWAHMHVRLQGLREWL